MRIYAFRFEEATVVLLAWRWSVRETWHPERLAIARVTLKSALVLIFAEATANLDALTETYG
jgi:ABC-type transport system involved in Fe-S cluster assembly fused permease/ATPase subunit